MKPILYILPLWGALDYCHAETQPPYADYCAMLARDIAGKQHGFLAGNHMYYVGGAAHVKWLEGMTEHETLGFTHPMFRDGRARGHGIVTDPQGGTGHDKWGWEFWRRTRVAYGTVIVEGKRHAYPKPEKMVWRPDRQVCVFEVGGVRIEEQKFISNSDVLCAIITSSDPVTLDFDGRTFICNRFIPTHDGDPPKTRFSRKCTATAEYDAKGNAFHIREGGTIMTKTAWGVPAREGRLMYDGMHAVLSASQDFQKTHIIEENKGGGRKYAFRLNCDPGKPLVLAYAMGDQYAPTLARVKNLLADPEKCLAAKTKSINDLLNNQIPYFRCSDEDAVKVYYYLWSLYFMYFTETGKGWEMYPHTQTAVNNFMGLHLWDSWAYTAVGAWVVDKWAWGHGNILSWKSMVPLKNKANALPDNFGIAWFSPGVRMNLVGAVEFACRQYEQSGDRKYLDAVYNELFKKLYWTGPQASHNIELNALDALIKMATVLGKDGDVAHWKSMRPRMVGNVRRLERRITDDKDFRWRDIWQPAALMCYELSDESAREMARRSVMNTETGFVGPVPLDVRPPDCPENGVFAVSTISTWLVVEGMFRHRCNAEAVFATLGHIRGMVKDFGYPIAPECWDPDYEPWGSMYYNWDVAILDPMIHRLAGIEYSIPDQSFTVRDHLPDSWDFVETYTPIALGGKTSWVRAKVERTTHGNRVQKRISVEGCPLKTLTIRPWLEDRELVGANCKTNGPPAHGYATFRFEGVRHKSVLLTLGKRERTFNTMAYLTPHSGQFNDSITVRIRNLLPGTTLRYTVDGRDPTADSPVCGQGLTFRKDTVLKLRAFSDDGTRFAPMTATYTRLKIDSNTPVIPPVSAAPLSGIPPDGSRPGAKWSRRGASCRRP